MTDLLVLAFAGGIGAVGRYLASGFVQKTSRSALPYGTAAVNLAGAFLLGVVIGAADAPGTATLAAVGVLGGFTTMSTWMVETVRLGVVPAPSRAALVNLVAVTIGGIAVSGAGYWLVH